MIKPLASGPVTKSTSLSLTLSAKAYIANLKDSLSLSNVVMSLKLIPGFGKSSITLILLFRSQICI